MNTLECGGLPPLCFQAACCRFNSQASLTKKGWSKLQHSRVLGFANKILIKNDNGNTLFSK